MYDSVCVRICSGSRVLILNPKLGDKLLVEKADELIAEAADNGAEHKAGKVIPLFGGHCSNHSVAGQIFPVTDKQPLTIECVINFFYIYL